MIDFKGMSEGERVAEIHRNAVEHGWWDGMRSDEEVFVMMHSEISEAVEEYRCGRPMVWYKSIVTGQQEADMDAWNGEKLEGVLVELADLVIRIYDWMGQVGDEPGGIRIQRERVGDFPEVCSQLHSNLVHELETKNRFFLCHAAALVEAYCGKAGYDLWEIVSRKHEYNLGRAYRHGGKTM